MNILFKNCSGVLSENKIVLVFQKDFFKINGQVGEFPKFLRSLAQFIRTVKPIGKKNHWDLETCKKKEKVRTIFGREHFLQKNILMVSALDKLKYKLKQKVGT